MEKEKSLSDKIVDGFDIFGKFLETLIEHTDGEIKRLKKKLFHFSLLVSMLIFSIVFILVGVAKILPRILGITEGLSFLIVGCIIIVVLSFYSIIHQID